MAERVDFSKEVDPKTVGMRPGAIDALAHTFETDITERHMHKAAQLVLLRHGQVVLDRALGVGRHNRPIDQDTPFYNFSVSKPFTGMCVHKLIDEGRVKLDARVADYWPEFGCKGKEIATIRHVFLHQAGIPAPKQIQQVFDWNNWPRLMRTIAGYDAVFTPGSQTWYHQLNYGFILGEVVRRVTGKMIDEYFFENFAQPLGLQHTRLRADKEMLKVMPRLYSYSKEHDLNVTAFNLFRGTLLPAASLASSARGLAVFFQMLLNGGKYDGRRLLKKETIKNATKLEYDGIDGSFGLRVQLGQGFFLGESLIRPIPIGRVPLKIYGSRGSASTFGHLGLGSTMVWADWDADVVVAFTCNGLFDDGTAGPRWCGISDGVWNALA